MKYLFIFLFSSSIFSCSDEVNNYLIENHEETTSLVETPNEEEEDPGEDYLPVIRIVDGDTFYLRNDDGSTEKVRLIGIDTPELSSNEPYADQARIYTYNLVNNRYVKLVYDVDKYDVYGRTLAYTYLSDGTFINDAIIKNGYARQLTIQPNSMYASLFAESLQYAKDHNLGMWRD